jgi:transposase
LDAQKKTLGATERNEAARDAYRNQVAQRVADDFVVVDECGTNINLTPIYARAPKGQRAIGRVPRNTAKNTTLIASMTTQGMGPAMLLEGGTDSIAVEAYVAQVLAPSLLPGQIVVMDNLCAHQRERVQRIIEARGCTVQYLPSYSPDLSPIEEAFSKLKTLLRRAAARTRDTLHDAIAMVLDQITARDAHGYFVHCGYGIHVQ